MPIFTGRAAGKQAARLLREQRRALREQRDAADMEQHPWWAQRTVRNLLTVLARGRRSR